ncbi:hypothetical protein [Neorhodopirellula pilleata]|uniref:Uncharacterized protein n=1 Tax=Neorhodopirellula pilleata TaxID=2714738 RepID=A0A5C6AT59_9BACT|nr:hypothetical protein [Neorhodopirellula pilleata]TWU03243.1 hypothetical protein Pla100_01610 [Neorhodopirellula pilleata]
MQIKIRSLNTHRRSGYVYVAVLITTLIVSAVVASTLVVSTSRRQMQIDTRDHHAAMALAHDELQRQLAMSRTQTDWRTGQTNNVFTGWRSGQTWMAGGLGQVRHRWNDPDGDLHDNPVDPVEISIHATVGRAEAAIQATLEVETQPLSVLQHAIVCDDDLRVENGARLSCVRGVVAGDDVRADTGSRIYVPYAIYADEASGTIDGDQVQDDEPLPTFDLIDLYSQGAVVIPQNALSVHQSQRRLMDLVLTSTQNPFGVAGPVYHITLNNKDFVVENCHVEATLVIENASKVILREGNVMLGDPATKVSIITDAPIEVVNWRGEVGDERSVLSGLYYTSDNIQMVNRLDNTPIRMRGCIIANACTVQTHTTIEKLDDLNLDPPPGFLEPAFLMVRPRTLRSIASP